MNTTIEVIGIYPTEADESVHLVEILVRNSEGRFDLSEFTQEVNGQPKQNWQVPWDERILDSIGEKVIADSFSVKKKPELWNGIVRLTFFFHYLDFFKPLITPFGLVPLINQKSKPDRLSEIEYKSPD